MKFRTALLFLLPALLAAPAAPQNPAAPEKVPAAPQSAPDLTSPDASVRSFANAVNGLDVNGANCVVGGKVDADLREWAQAARRFKEVFQITILSVQPQVNGDSATATVSMELKAHGQQQRLEETVALREIGSDWKIVPPTEAELGGYFKAGDKEPHVITVLATLYAHPKMLINARDAALAAACRSNLKQLALGTLMLLQDSDEKFALKADSYKSTIGPYVKNESVFRCPSDEHGPVAYSFNPQLQGKRMTAVRKPALTVMIYEGKKGVLNFRHDGRAMVAFADGHVKPVTPAEARALRWAP